jgi:hypothetical protein
MNLARRSHQRLVRWTSLCVCFALVLTSLAILPFASVNAALGTEPLAVASGSITQLTPRRAGAVARPLGMAQGARAMDKAFGQDRRVNPAPLTGPPPGILPNLDDMKRISDQDRRHGGRRVQAPDPVPSTQRRWKHGGERAEFQRSEIRGQHRQGSHSAFLCEVLSALCG